jgi:hypothetical protein
MTYRKALLSGFRERSVGAKMLSAVGIATVPLLPFLSWLLSLPSEIQALLWAVLVVVAWLVGLDAGRIAWKKTRADLVEAQGELAKERRYKATVCDDLEALGQRLYKRTVEWWVASLEQDRPKAEGKKAEAEAVMHEINVKLTAEVNAADAGYFRRPRAYEPFRPNMALLPDGNWINEMWYRVNRLEEIIERVRYGTSRSR